MFRLIITLSVVAVAGVYGSLDVFQACIDTQTNITSNEYLLGTWHRVYKFTLFGGLVPSSQCSNRTFSTPTAEQLQSYKEKYDSAGFPFTLDESSLHFEDEKDAEYTTKLVGLYSRDTEAKYWVMDPKNAMVLMYGYSVDVYQIIDENYMLYWDCSLRGHTRYLMSRNRDAPLAEIQAIIAAHPVLKHMGQQRFCAP